MCAYHVLAGKRPWQDEDDVRALMVEVLCSSPPPLSELAPELPTKVVAVIERALSKPAADRYERMEDAVAELCYEVGVALETDYGYCGSGASPADAREVSPPISNMPTRSNWCTVMITRPLHGSN